MKRRWTVRVLIKFILLQLPLLVLLPMVLFFIRQWVDIPVWLIWGIVALLIIKDTIMFPIVWRSYDQSLPGPGDPASIVGMQGIAKDRLAPTGYIQVRSELWRAEVMEGSAPIAQGKGVQVVGIEGLTLLVRAEDEHQQQQDADHPSDDLAAGEAAVPSPLGRRLVARIDRGPLFQLSRVPRHAVLLDPAARSQAAREGLIVAQHASRDDGQ